MLKFILNEISCTSSSLSFCYIHTDFLVSAVHISETTLSILVMPAHESPVIHANPSTPVRRNLRLVPLEKRLENGRHYWVGADVLSMPKLQLKQKLR